MHFFCFGSGSSFAFFVTAGSLCRRFSGFGNSLLFWNVDSRGHRSICSTLCSYQFWSTWKEALIIVTPGTMVRWHRTRFPFYWRLISGAHKPVARRRVSNEVRELIFLVVVENPTWGAPGTHDELLMLGFDVSERTILRYMKRAPRDPDPSQALACVSCNNRETIGAMGFFAVPTIPFSALYCFFVIGHDRRRTLHSNLTRHPRSSRIVRQLREAFPCGSAPRFLIFDRDARHGAELPAAMRSMKIKCARTSLRSPWQNGVVERKVGNCRRDLLDHLISFDERYLKRLLPECVRCCLKDRTHLGLGKRTPNKRPRSIASDRILSHARLGGRHDRHDRATSPQACGSETAPPNSILVNCRAC